MKFNLGQAPIPLKEEEEKKSTEYQNMNSNSGRAPVPLKEETEEE